MHGIVDRGARRTLEGTVKGRIDLVRTAREIDGQAVAVNRRRRADLERLVEVDTIVVEPALSVVRAVGDFRNGVPQHALRVIHPVLNGRKYDFHTVFVQQFREALDTVLSRGNHRLEVVLIHRRRAHVIENSLPELFVLLALFIELQRIVDARLGVDIAREDIHARRMRAIVQQMCLHAGETDKLAFVENRQTDMDIW